MSDPVLEIASAGARWTAKERELWLDMFTNFCESIMGATLEEHSGLRAYPAEQLKTDITLAGELADHAVAECIFRMMKNRPELKRRETRRAGR